jgi:tetratricopeptide (TPR) repeat protein
MYVSFYKNIAVTLLNYGIYTEAVQSIDAALSIDPNATDLLTNKGIFLMNLRYYQEAIKIFDGIQIFKSHTHVQIL